MLNSYVMATQNNKQGKYGQTIDLSPEMWNQVLGDIEADEELRDLGLVETARALGLSKSEFHRIRKRERMSSVALEKIAKRYGRPYPVIVARTPAAAETATLINDPDLPEEKLEYVRSIVKDMITASRRRR